MAQEDVLNKQELLDQIDALTVDGGLESKDINYLINYLNANGNMTGTPRDLIQIRRGYQADLPILAQGELAFAYDSSSLYVGGLNGNVQLGSMFIDVKQHGAKGNGIKDDTEAVRKAIQAIPKEGGVLYFPAGTYIIKDELVIYNQFVIVQGANKNASIIKVPIGASTTAQGIFVVKGNEPACIFRDLQITFDQIDTDNRAELYFFPPAIYAYNQPRIRLEHMRIVKAMKAVDARGNCGGAYFHDCEMSFLTVGIDLDGSYDSVRINQCHFWGFDLSAKQNKIMKEVETIGLRIGRVDDLHVTDALFYAGTSIHMFESSAGLTFGEIVNSDFDAHSGLKLSGGQLNISNCNFTVSESKYQAINMTGGQLLISTCWFYCVNGIPVAEGKPLIEVNGQRADETIFNVQGSYFNTEGSDLSAIRIEGNVKINVSGNNFRKIANISYQNPVVDILSGRATVIGNQINDKGIGTGDFINIHNDDHHRVGFNTPVGWGIKHPVGGSGFYEFN